MNSQRVVSLMAVLAVLMCLVDVNGFQPAGLRRVMTRPKTFLHMLVDVEEPFKTKESADGRSSSSNLSPMHAKIAALKAQAAQFRAEAAGLESVQAAERSQLMLSAFKEVSSILLVFHIEKWCIRQLLSSSIILCILTSIAHNHHTNIPFLNLNNSLTPIRTERSVWKN